MSFSLKSEMRDVSFYLVGFLSPFIYKLYATAQSIRRYRLIQLVSPKTFSLYFVFIIYNEREGMGERKGYGEAYIYTVQVHSVHSHKAYF